MPSNETSYLNQTAVLWRANGTDAYGEPSFSTPEEINVRWVNKSLLDLNPTANNIGINARVATEVDIEVDSLLWLGTLEEWYGVGSAGTSPDGASDSLSQVKSFNRVPDIKGREYRRVFDVVRYRERAH
jgi:hypothetical protein